jgi:F-type H+-transporting ATPase subunit epsilon
LSEKFKVEVVTPSKAVIDKEVEEVIAPGIMGEFGVLVGHTPMLTFVKPGVLSYLENDKFIKFAVGEGFCEVLADRVSVLVDEAYAVEELEAGAISSEIQNLEQQLVAIDATADPEGYRKLTGRLKMARAKLSLAAGS